MAVTVDDLGFTKEELQERIIEDVSRQILRSWATDEDGDPIVSESPLAQELRKQCAVMVEKHVGEFCERHVLPRIKNLTEYVTLQETNKWGEKKGAPMTFKEYLVHRAENYLTEKVNWDGKTKNAASFGWTGVQNRLTFLINKHLHHHIEQAIKTMLAEGNKVLTKGIEETVRLKLKEIERALTVTVKTGR